MIRRIIQIDEDKCNGCGACANARHDLNGCIGMVNGKQNCCADDYCDGLGDWVLPTCSGPAPLLLGTGSCCLRRRSCERKYERRKQRRKNLQHSVDVLTENAPV